MSVPSVYRPTIRCRLTFPFTWLTMRLSVDQELKPWEETGITRQMLDQLWRCDDGAWSNTSSRAARSEVPKPHEISQQGKGSRIAPRLFGLVSLGLLLFLAHGLAGHPERYPHEGATRRFAGLKAIVRSGVVQVEKAVHVQVRPRSWPKLVLHSDLSTCGARFSFFSLRAPLSRRPSCT